MFVRSEDLQKIKWAWSSFLLIGSACMVISVWIVWVIGGVGWDVSRQAMVFTRALLYVLAIGDCATGYWIGYGEEVQKEKVDQENGFTFDFFERIKQYPMIVIAMVLSPSVYSVILTALFRNGWDIFLSVISLIILTLLKPRLKREKKLDSN